MFAGLIVSRLTPKRWQPFGGLSDNRIIFKKSIKISVNSRPYNRQNCAEIARNYGEFNECKWSDNGSG